MPECQTQLEVQPDPAEVSRARKWARSRIGGWGIASDDPVAEVLVLIISELVTNAVVHTGCSAVLRMFCSATVSAGDGYLVRVEVADASETPPRPRHARGADTGGRGLALIDHLADRWGWQQEERGKRVWCELDRRRPVLARTAGTNVHFAAG